jgi:tellurite resistance protein TerC
MNPGGGVFRGRRSFLLNREHRPLVLDLWFFNPQVHSVLAMVEITPWHWIAFLFCVLVFLALDLGVFHRTARVVRFREAMGWTALWFVLAMGFAAALVPLRSQDEAVEFVTGYLLELALSMDNVFVIALIFGYFRVPTEYQHRVLFWGILGALLMRGIMIGTGSALVDRVQWILYLLGALVVYSGVKMLFTDPDVHPDKNPVIKLARKFFPVSSTFDGQKFLTRMEGGQRALTPLALVLVMVETTDLVFALDSIPAIFGITTKRFIVFTSNVFAILGLRSLYFVLAGAIDYFRYLKYGLAIVLIFIGVKMLIEYWHIKLSTMLSLAVVAGIILVSIIVSAIAARRERAREPRQEPGT